MKTLEFDYFFKQLKAGMCIDESCFYFSDDAKKDEHYVGFLPQYEKPYWVGYCDIPDGTEFRTAEELVNAKIFQGKSLKEKWDTVRFVSIEGLCLEDWLEFFKHV